MARPRFSVLIAVVFLSMAVAGCIGGDDKPETIKTPVIDTPVEANNTTTLGPLGVPTWVVGQWWAHHTYRGYEDATGTHFNVMVVDAAGDYKVAPESSELAMQDAMEDVWDIGTISAADLSTTRGGTPWSWYQFPLEHNKTWNQAIDIEGVNYDLTFTVTYNDTLRTAQGDKEGFDITGVTADNFTALSYDYIEELGWFSDLEMYDPAANNGKPVYQILNMGYGLGRTGEYVEVSVSNVLTYSNAVNLSAPTGDLTATFTVPEGATKLIGGVAVGAENGQTTLTLADPSGGTTDYTAAAPGATVVEQVEIVRPEVGDWTVTFLGIGTAAWAAMMLDAVVETVGTY